MSHCPIVPCGLTVGWSEIKRAALGLLYPSLIVYDQFTWILDAATGEGGVMDTPVTDWTVAEQMIAGNIKERIINMTGRLRLP
jgi:hypothetical protein